MKLVIKHGDEFATTSEIIAQNTDTQHKNVLELIGTYTEQIEQFGPFAFQTRKSGGRPTEYAILNEQQSTFLLTLMRNTEIVVRFKVELVKEFYRMRSLASTPLVPQTLSEALRLAADLSDEKEKMAEQLSIAAPKVAALERIAEAGGSLGLQEAGKALQQKPNKFIGWLRENGWIYRRAGSGTNLGRAEKVNAGYITHKVTTVSREDGSEKIVEQVLITPKGLARLAVILGVTANDSDMEGEAA